MKMLEGDQGFGPGETSRHGSPGGSAELLRAAERELERVQGHEIAWLLAGAAALRAARSSPRGVLAVPPIRPASIHDWRARTELTLSQARDERSASSPGAALLARIVARPVRSWPGPVELAQAALREHVDDELRAALAHAHLAQGEGEQALHILSGVLRSLPRRRPRGAILEGQAAALLQLGRVRLSFAAYDQAADDPGSSVLSLVSALYLALCLGDPARARRAAARLDLLVDPCSSTFLGALARLRSHLQLADPGLPRPAQSPAVELFELLLAAPRSPSGKVCQLLV